MFANTQKEASERRRNTQCLIRIHRSIMTHQERMS